MIVINGKKYTKKAGQAILRTLDRTAIFKLYKQLTGKIDRGEIFEFIKNYAPSQKVAKAAFSIAYNSPHQSVDDCYKGKHGYFEPLPRQKAVDYTKEMVKVPSAYAKYPIMGQTHLYFASVSYGHSDYNKWRSVPIKGNEAFCKVLINYVKRFNISGYGE